MLYAREDEARKNTTEKLRLEKMQADSHYMMAAQRVKELENELQQTTAKHEEETRRMWDRHAEDTKRLRDVQDDRDQIRAQNVWLTSFARDAAEKMVAEQVRQKDEACRRILESIGETTKAQMIKVRDALSNNHMTENDLANVRLAVRDATSTVLSTISELIGGKR
jgi:hypothetical protein